MIGYVKGILEEIEEKSERRGIPTKKEEAAKGISNKTAS